MSAFPGGSGAWLPAGVILYLAVAGFLFTWPFFQWRPAFHTYLRWRRRQNVVCPETGRTASIELPAGRAALAVLSGRAPVPRGCSLWPEMGRCQRRCLRGVGGG